MRSQYGRVAVVLLALTIGQQSPAVLGSLLGPVLGGLSGTLLGNSGSAGSAAAGAGGASASAASSGSPASGALGLVSGVGNVLGGVSNSLLGVPNSVLGAVGSAASGAAGAVGGLGAAALGAGLGSASGSGASASAAAAGSGSNNIGYGLGAGSGGSAASAASAAAGSGSGMMGSGFGLGAGAGGAGASAAAASAADGVTGGFGPMVRGGGLGGYGPIMGGQGAFMAGGRPMLGMSADGLSSPSASSSSASSAAAGSGGAGAASAAGAASGSSGAIVEAGDSNIIDGASAKSQLGREALANEAFDNAQAEASIAGADMMAHGANNARSASLASNAYRQAKLASARDRINVAGTIQNTARISDAAIATHDAATKAEDSLLGSELAADSAATVLDSDAAYIPPVTNSLLRSLPYGRLGLRNIIPKPLTYPSHLLPDVWLNGQPVNYLNVPLRQLLYGGNYANNICLANPGSGSLISAGNSINNLGCLGSAAVASNAALALGANPFLAASGALLAGGVLRNGQPFYSSNGWPINGLVMDPTAAYLTTSAFNGPAASLGGSSIYPVLANGQLEAQDEIGAANAQTMKQQAGSGMLSTYFGFGRMNPVPLLTGTVSDSNLAPTTTIGTTYPIGSALVIEPRDSYFQDYIDSASSRQNYDERQQ